MSYSYNSNRVNSLFDEKTALKFFTGEPKSHREYMEHFKCHHATATRHIEALGSKLVARRWDKLVPYYTVRENDSEIDVLSPGDILRLEKYEKLFNQTVDELRPSYLSTLEKAHGEKERQATLMNFIDQIFDRYDDLVDEYHGRQRDRDRRNKERRKQVSGPATPWGILTDVWRPNFGASM